MGMVVRTNMAALNANNALGQASKAQQNGMQKLASGFKINKAADDASGLAISEKMKNQIKALDTAKDNCEDGANLIQTAEGYMNETHDMLNRMTELAEKAANGTLGDEDRKSLQKEMDQLCGEIDRIASTANFNGHKLMDGSIGSTDKVKVSSSVDGFKYEAPADATKQSKQNVISGGKLDATPYTFAADKTEANMQITSITAGSDATKLTVKAKEVLADGTLGNTEVSFDCYVKKGDTLTLDNSGAGTSSNGIKFTGASASKNATLTFDGTQWVNESGVAADVTGLKANTLANAAAGDNFKLEKTDPNAPLAKEGINLQIGESSTSADRLTVSINSFHTDSLFGGLDGLVNKSNDSTDQAATAAVKITTSPNHEGEGNTSSTYKDAVSINITDKDSAAAAADAIRQISNYVSDERGKLGAQQNRLEHTVNNLTTASENTTAANSRIRDTDMAKEMMAYTSKNVIAQAAQSMLAQANSQPQNVLSLLQ